MNKSPFLIYENFISPSLCENIVDQTGWVIAEKASHTTDDAFSDIIIDKINVILPQIEQQFETTNKLVEPVNFERIPSGVGSDPQCESSTYVKTQWIKTKRRDFCGVLFLTDYNDTAPIDPEFECYGGKLEFPNHKFGFNPRRGTLIIYPSDPRFINSVSNVQVGTLHLMRICMESTTPYVYDPKMFPGNYTTWFK